MGPNGEGANLAMYDGAQLAQALAAHPDDIEAAIAEYEQTMFARSHRVAVESAKMREILTGAKPQDPLDMVADLAKSPLAMAATPGDAEQLGAAPENRRQ
nr:hypothetical protein [Kibdelosporangium sp. MJ126-NF4]CEL15762.1 putative monooxygenase [Kibdelosporangium sp. MJ126-NF4]CTQ93688.1 putative monooxygenase [Kibdelosporangium sp. MJ126-NF4]